MFYKAETRSGTRTRICLPDDNTPRSVTGILPMLSRLSLNYSRHKRERKGAERYTTSSGQLAPALLHPLFLLITTLQLHVHGKKFNAIEVSITPPTNL